MPFINNPDQQHQETLKKFRINFLHLIADGSFPPHRQQRLFQWCKKWALDWDTARRFIADDAMRLLQQIIGKVVADGKITPQEVAGLQKLQRRLGLSDADGAQLSNLYDMIERKIEGIILERAAYLSSEHLVSTLKQEIAAYQLPAQRQERLFEVLDRQHELAKPMAGQLPIITPSVSLYRDELCHLDISATFVPRQAAAKDYVGGKLIATSQRLMMLSAGGGFSISWQQLVGIIPDAQSIQLFFAKQNGAVSVLDSGQLFCADLQYVATVLAMTRRIYNPSAPPQPRRPGRRLAN